MNHHLGYAKHERNTSPNARNGYSKKTILSDKGHITLDIPRDRESSFESKIVKKNETRFTALNDRIVSLYAKGMSIQDIQAELLDAYDVEVSSSLISNVTNEVLIEVKAWQNRPLDKVYPIVLLDCIVPKVRDDNQIVNKSVYCALAVNMEGKKDLLGMWIGKNESAKFWLNVLTELKNRGLKDILIACVDGLSGFPEAIKVIYPDTQVQLCIVHMIRNSMKYVSYKDRKEAAEDLKRVYQSVNADTAKEALIEMKKKWGKKYPYITKNWENKWENVIPFFSYPAEIRKAIYTTNAIESMNMTLRKVIKNKRVFPNDESVLKLLYLAINNIAKKWTMPIKDWAHALNYFSIEFEGRI